MTLLILGIALWSVAHFIKRIAPDFRQSLTDRFAKASRGIIAGLLVLSVILMVVGYKQADANTLYVLPAWAVHLNNLLMLFAVALFGMGASKGRARTWLRHPMLTGMAVWAVAHLLVNGDTPSVVLFGSMLIWSLVSMRLINAGEGEWIRPEPGPLKGDIKLIVITLVLFTIISVIHGYVGPSPFMR